jgi:hypothetical protein
MNITFLPSKPILGILATLISWIVFSVIIPLLQPCLWGPRGEDCQHGGKPRGNEFIGCSCECPTNYFGDLCQWGP